MTGLSPAAAIEATGVVAILRGVAARELDDVLQSLLAGGIRAIEISLTTPGAVDLIAHAIASAGDRAAIGAGTVLTADAVRRVAGVGARFVVSPVFDRDVVGAAIEAGLFPLPGVLSPTEAMQALSAGAPAVKLFPAVAVGAAFVRSLRAPLPELKMVPTGGVTLDLAREFAGAGAWAVGVGLPLVAAKPGAELEARARAFVAAMRPAPAVL